LAKSWFFLKNEIDNPSSNFRGTTIQCISIDWYLITSTFLTYADVNTEKSPQKATDWSGIKIGSLLKQSQRSWYQSIDEKHIQVHVKFESWLSIPFRKKMKCKKSGSFSMRWSVLFPNGGGWNFWKVKFLETDRFWTPNLLYT
jgi:hypothetical protein